LIDRQAASTLTNRLKFLFNTTLISLFTDFEHTQFEHDIAESANIAVKGRILTNFPVKKTFGDIAPRVSFL
jgi:hypothetical protein